MLALNALKGADLQIYTPCLFRQSLVTCGFANIKYLQLPFLPLHYQLTAFSRNRRYHTLRFTLRVILSSLILSLQGCIPFVFDGLMERRDMSEMM